MNKITTLLRQYGLTFRLVSKILFRFQMHWIHYFSMVKKLSHQKRPNSMGKLHCTIFSKLPFATNCRIMVLLKSGIYEETPCWMLIRNILIWFLIQPVRSWFSRTNNLFRSNTLTHLNENWTFSKLWCQEFFEIERSNFLAEKFSYQKCSYQKWNTVSKIASS